MICLKPTPTPLDLGYHSPADAINPFQTGSPDADRWDHGHMIAGWVRDAEEREVWIGELNAPMETMEDLW